MDLFVRYFDINSNKVNTRYFNSTFMGPATAQDILDIFNQGISPIARKSILQVSMDGPNVNLSFIKKFSDQIRKDGNANGKQLVILGVYGLHVVNGALKTGTNSVKWDLQGLFSDMYYLLNDCPARRAEYTSITGSTTFPMKYCTTRWLENVKCVERALMIIDHMAKFVTNIKGLSSKLVKNQLKDKFIKCKLAFFKVLKDAANRWTDNIYSLKSWCKNKFNIEGGTLDKSFSIPVDLDYID